MARKIAAPANPKKKVSVKKVTKKITKKVAKKTVTKTVSKKGVPKKIASKKAAPKKAPAKKATAKKSAAKKADKNIKPSQNVSEENKSASSKNTMYILLLDESGSMRNEWPNLIAAAKDFAALVTPPAKLSIINYASDATLKGENLSSPEALKLLTKLERGGGFTNFGRPLIVA